MADKQMVLNAIDDMIRNFLYYDRKEDEDLPRGEIERFIEEGELSVEEIVERFTTSLRELLDE